jgi:hypothetical protein
LEDGENLVEIADPGIQGRESARRELAITTGRFGFSQSENSELTEDIN